MNREKLYKYAFCFRGGLLDGNVFMNMGLVRCEQIVQPDKTVKVNLDLAKDISPLEVQQTLDAWVRQNAASGMQIVKGSVQQVGMETSRSVSEKRHAVAPPTVANDSLNEVLARIIRVERTNENLSLQMQTMRQQHVTDSERQAQEAKMQRENSDIEVVGLKRRLHDTEIMLRNSHQEKLFSVCAMKKLQLEFKEARGTITQTNAALQAANQEIGRLKQRLGE